jgi:glycerate kinase
MNIIIAPDKFRGSLDANEVCDAVERGILLAFPTADIVKIPLADGGEGTVSILTKNENGRFVEVEVSDPLGRKIQAVYGVSENGKTAFIEMSAASGLSLLRKEEQNPLLTSTFGTGEMIAHALAAGVEKIILGIGGSATTDAGIGMASALGYSFLDDQGNTLAPIGANLGRIRTIVPVEVNPRIASTEIIVACDVTNPLYGKNGAAHVYSPQKGADKQAVQLLDQGLERFSQVATRHFSVDLSQIPGAGAAGGVGAGAVWFLNANLAEGVRIVMDQVNLPAKIKQADLVITGEGKADEQTLSGKVVKGLASYCQQANVPLALICGTLLITPTQAEEAGITYATSVLNRPMDLDTAQAEAAERVSEAAYYLTRLFSQGVVKSSL